MGCGINGAFAAGEPVTDPDGRTGAFVMLVLQDMQLGHNNTQDN
jgi:hypothetical protein